MALPRNHLPNLRSEHHLPSAILVAAAVAALLMSFSLQAGPRDAQWKQVDEAIAARREAGGGIAPFASACLLSEAKQGSRRMQCRR
jgi:hypothetical protein